eukprot:364868-Chlamydomonas_euryale.AAC.15
MHLETGNQPGRGWLRTQLACHAARVGLRRRGPKQLWTRTTKLLRDCPTCSHGVVPQDHETQPRELSRRWRAAWGEYGDGLPRGAVCQERPAAGCDPAFV